MKILVVRQQALGDVILSTGIVRALYNKYQPDCEIVVSTENPLVFDRSPYATAATKVDPALFDLVINLDQAYELKPKLHPIEAYAERANVAVEDLKPEMFADHTDREFIDNLKLSDRFVVLHLRKYHGPNRNLPMEFYKELILRILKELDHAIVLVGHGTDYFVRDIPGKLVNLVNKLTVHQNLALIDRASAFVGVDAGLLHVAACTETPILGFFTAVRAEYREPRYRQARHINIASNIECYGCVETLPAPLLGYKCARQDNECVRRFDVDHAMTQLKSLL